MKKCIIHIGMHKTGSTSIQESLNKFYDKNFYYARLGAPNHSIAIYSLFSQNPQAYAHFKGFTSEEISSFITEVRQNLIKSIKNANKRILIISGEDIRLLSQDELYIMKSFLQDYGYNDINIFSYIRSPIEYIQSAFQEILKATFISLKDIKQCYPNYRESFEKFLKVFGREHVYFRKFSLSKFPNGCVVRDFCNFFGINLLEGKIKRANESFPLEIVGLFYIFRKFIKNNEIKASDIQSLGNSLFTLLEGLTLNKFYISYNLIKPILDINADDIRWMEENLGESLILEGLDSTIAVETEDDLLTVREDVLERLKHYEYSEGIFSREFYEYILNLIDIVKMIKNKIQTYKITISDLSQKIMQKNQRENMKVPLRQSKIILKYAFSEIRKNFDLIENGKLNVHGLGDFIIKSPKQKKSEKETFLFIPNIKNS